MDSLDIVEFVMELETEFGIALPTSAGFAFAPQTRLADVWRAIVFAQSGSEPSGLPSPSDPVWLRLRRLAALRFDMPLDDVDPSLHLGL
jgi:hypothetical protein